MNTLMNGLFFSRNFNRFFVLLVTFCLLIGFVGCRRHENPVTFSVAVPEENTLEFTAELTQRFGLGLQGNFEVLEYGSLFLVPETGDQNFQFGFQLHTDTFLKESWVNYQEVTTLPTGAAFPSWVTTPMVDVQVPPINTDPVGWHFYFGTRGQFYLAVAGLISGINENFPELYIEYSFYDDQGRMVLGLVFFGPNVDSGGNLIESGGIMVGTNLTPFLPPEVLETYTEQEKELAVEPETFELGTRTLALKSLKTNAYDLVRKANLGQPIEVEGQSLVSEVRVFGKEAKKYKNPRKLKKVIKRFVKESKK